LLAVAEAVKVNLTRLGLMQEAVVVVVGTLKG
jgi:hypothetical protein